MPMDPPSAGDVTRDGLIEAARELAPIAREEAERAEKASRIPEHVYRALVERGFFRTLLPKRYGGYEFEPAVAARIVLELADKLEGVDARRFLQTIADYNAAIGDEVPFNPNVKDGRRTNGLAIDKTNWANTIDTPPFEGYAVTCGITFTFGGLRTDNDGRVVDTNFDPIPGLYAAGECVGGLFYFNYPGGTGLTTGSVFGRLAGDSAGQAVGG